MPMFQGTQNQPRREHVYGDTKTRRNMGVQDRLYLLTFVSGMDPLIPNSVVIEGTVQFFIRS